MELHSNWYNVQAAKQQKQKNKIKENKSWEEWEWDYGRVMQRYMVSWKRRNREKFCLWKRGGQQWIFWKWFLSPCRLRLCFIVVHFLGAIFFVYTLRINCINYYHELIVFTLKIWYDYTYMLALRSLICMNNFVVYRFCYMILV